MMNNSFIKKILKPLLPKYSFAVFIGTFLNVLVVLSTFLTKILIDDVLPQKEIRLLWSFVLGFLGFFAFKNTIQLLKKYIFAKYGYSLLLQVRDNVFDSILCDFDYARYSAENKGLVLTLFRDWLNSISWFLSNVLLTTISDIVLLLFVLIVLAFYNYRLFITLLIMLPLYSIIYYVFSAKLKAVRRMMMEKDVITTTCLSHALDSLKEIRVFALEEEFVNEYHHAQQGFCKNGLKYELISSLYMFTTNYTGVLGRALVLLIGGISVCNNIITTGTLVSLMTVVSLAFNPIESLVNFVRVLQTFKLEYGKLVKTLEANISSENPTNKSDYLARQEISKSDQLLLKDVSFYYGSKCIFSKINISFNSGGKYAIVGSNGSGKSTLVGLITGVLQPEKGNIFFDGINIYEDILTYKRKIGYVAQDSYMLNDTIFNNVVFKRHAASCNALSNLLKICEVDQILEENSMDINSVIGDRGNLLSGGQKQKVALCRALYDNPDILIIDEGTSNIDSESEKRIIRNILTYRSSITLLIVSHRYSTVKLADYVYVIGESGVIEQGKISELKRQATLFNEMFINQFDK